ncbi:B-cell receptor CD22 [Kryptolebias marmoratus]|uniref:B-cell receptor CD22 n=1 Tax=Kryptolebias marmoratus TaxID=37003 RepID=UPI0007F912AC|nr:B-cell receptor CD22 [Kryptolebias marmoratus]
MSISTVKWFIVLALITDVSCNKINPFVLVSQHVTAKEGSCVEIKCKPDKNIDINGSAYWFWMKDAEWVETSFKATIVYSTNVSSRAVSPTVTNRNKYTSSPPTSWDALSADKLCNLLICDLNKTDDGNYKFRFINENLKWATQNQTNLTVEENPCLITFNKSASVMENDTVTLICSTISTCQSELQIYTLTQQPLSYSNSPKTSGTATHSFKASWKDNGKVFSCKTKDNTDWYLIKNLTLTVKHGPKNVIATVSRSPVVENESVNLTCSADGQPSVTFSWFKAEKAANPTFPSIRESDKGSYYCVAKNDYGTEKSSILNIDVLYVPEVSVAIRNKSPSPSSGNTVHFKEGDQIVLECNVKRSNPQPDTFIWKRNGKDVGKGKTYEFNQIKPEDGGNYTCEARNSVSSGKSKSLHLQVQYKPRSSISLHGASDNKVKINSNLRLTCNTTANPDPYYSWYSYRKPDHSHWKWLGNNKNLTLNPVQRTDEACYVCNASNSIGKGNNSRPECIQVLFPPTNVQLTLPPEVKEGQSITITCTAESFPPSNFKILRSSLSNSQSSENISTSSANERNTFTHTFDATLAHAGSYICEVSNSEGTNHSAKRKLEVKYSPKDVKIKAQNGLEVKENESFSLNCNGQSNPPITSYTWMKKTDNKNIGRTSVYTVKSASPSDGGLYSCEAKNTIGTGRSQPVEVKIKYGPKLTTISKGKEQQLSSGLQSVTLSCNSHCYPAAKFVWYNKMDGEKHNMQNITVYSNQAGEYYCTAKNEFGEKASDPINPFDDSVKRIVRFLILICFVILIIVIIFIFYRRNKSNQPRTTNMWPCSGFLVCWNGRRTTMNENMLSEPVRSRDDLLPEHAQRRQPHPDITSASHIYATVNLPQTNQAPFAQKPAGQQQELVENDSVNYASLHFEKKKKKKPEVDSVYSLVCKPVPPTENKQQMLKDYENVDRINPTKPSFSYEDDSDTSEDEVEVSYSTVNFKSKPGHQRATRNSSSSEDGPVYSQVKL